MRSLTSPQLHENPKGLAMDMGNETSVWEDIEDEEEVVGGLMGSLKSRLRLRTSSTKEETNGIFGAKVRQGRKKMRRCLSEVVRGVFMTRKTRAAL
jgi:hypothetical protein